MSSATRFLLFTALTWLLLPSGVSAQTNLDFESGTLAGWTSSPGIAPSFNTNVAVPGGFPAGAGARVGYIYAYGDGNGTTGGTLSQTFLLTPCNSLVTIRYKSCVDAGSGEGNGLFGGPWFNYRISVAGGTPAVVTNTYFWESTACTPSGTVTFDLAALGVPAGNYIGKNVTISFTAETCHNDDGWGYGSAYVDASTSCLLPMEIVALSAEKAPQGNVINWETATETQILNFVLEKSADQQNWQSIAELSSCGHAANYSATDPTPGGTTWYRVFQQNSNGEIFYTSILEVIRGEQPFSNWMSVQPCPGQNEVYITWADLPDEGNAGIEILDINGRLIKSATQGDLRSANQRLDVSDLSPGVYVFRIRSRKAVVCTRWIKNG